MPSDVFISNSDYDAVIFDLDGVEFQEPAIRLIRALRSVNLKTAVVSSSKNCREILDSKGVADLFDGTVDGQDLQSLEMEGKLAPEMYLEAAARLHVDPRRAVVVDNTISGVRAGRAGRFGLVIGVNRGGQNVALKTAGADVVVNTLSSIVIAPPHALSRLEEIRSRAGGKTIAVFLDYDGTLTPIVSDPEKAILSDSMRQVLKILSERIPISVISGRDLPDVQRITSLRGIFYAGSHGFDIAGPEGMHLNHQLGVEFLPTLDQAEKELVEELASIEGARVERKKFAIAVHYRHVKTNEVESVKRAVERVASRHSDLRQSGGKKVFELQPKTDWHKGKALLWLLETMDLDGPEVLPFYIGDDVTDEDAFRTLKGLGIGIVVMEEPRPTEAQYRLRNPDEVKAFLEALTKAEEFRPHHQADVDLSIS